MDTAESGTVTAPPLSSAQAPPCFDWTMHKFICKSFATLEARPGPDFFRGIFFPPDQPLPRFVWIKYYSSEDWTTIAPNEVTGEIMSGHFQPGTWPLERPVSHCLGIFYTDRYMTDGSSLTPSITKWIGTASGTYFRGPYLAHGHENDNMDEYEEVEEFGRPCDLDTADLSYLLDFFKAQGANLRKGTDWNGVL
ncbi:hypothetical protein Ptr902_06809 [Pyrenophora tritici-repentis]|nr:hypothetical protein Ptr902_06809 [Pyrenophora tritici-repentis]